MFKTFFSILAFLTATTVYADAVIFSGNDVKTLKPNIDLFGQGKILSGTIDPSSVATSAPVGSIYLNTSNGNLYRKVDAGSSTNWQKVGSAGVSGSIVPNPDWETGTSGWTASAGSYARTTTAADVAFGAGSGSFDASAASQTLTSTAVSIPTGLYANNGLASCSFKTAATDYLLQVYDGTNVLVSTTIPASTQYQKISANFIFPSSGSLSIRIRSQSNAAILYMDDCYLGSASNLTNVSQAQVVGTAVQAGSGGCQYLENTSTGESTFVSLGAGTTCNAWTTSGSVAPVGTNDHRMTLSNVGPGQYEVTVTGLIISTAMGVCNFRLSDGTNAFNGQTVYSNAAAGGAPVLVFAPSYTTAQGNLTFTIQAGDNHAGSCGVENTNVARSMSWTFKRFPSTSELAVSANLPGAPTVQKFTSGSGTYTRPNGVKYLRVRMVGGGGGGSDGASRSGVDGGDTTFGGLTAARGKGAVGGGPSGSPGVVSSGSSLSTFSGTLIEGSAGNAGMANAAGRARGGNGGTSFFGGAGLGPQCESGTVNGGTATANSGSGGGGGCSGGSPNAIQGHGGGAGGYVEAFIPNPSTTYSYSVGGAGSGAVNGGAGGAGYIEVTEYYGVLDVPILVGSVTSNSSGAERVERLLFTNAGTPIISKQSGSWVSSLTDNNPGDTTVNFVSGIFSDTPSCICVGVENNPNPYTGCMIKTASSTSVRVWTFVTNTAGTAVDRDVHLICMGPR